MPIYEYACQDCGKEFEKLVRNHSAKELACPSCGERNVKQKLSVFAAHSGSTSRQEAMPRCPSGMCPTPGLCGRN